MANISEKFEDDAIEYQIQLKRVEAGLRKKTVASLEQLETDIIQILNTNSKGLSAGKKKSLNATLAATKKQISGIYKQIADHGATDLEKIATMTSAQTAKSLGASIGVSHGPMQLSASQASTIANGPVIEGSDMQGWWQAQTQPTQSAIANEIQQGMLMGEGIDEMTRRIRGTKKNNYQDGILEQGPKRKAEAIVRTAVQNTSNEAGIATMEKSAMVKGIRWISTLDTRTTPICRGLDGLEWKLPGYEPIGHGKEWPGATAHWGCRSTQIAVLHDWDDIAKKKLPDTDETFQKNFEKRLAAKGKTPAEIATIGAKQRASIDGQVSSNLTFDTWAKKKGDTYLQQLLGPGRFKLYKKHNLTMRELTDQKGRELTIEQLGDAIAKGTLAEETEGQPSNAAFDSFVDPTPAIAATPVKADTKAEEAAAQLVIDDIIANPKGQTLKAKALKQLQTTEPDTPAHLLLAKAEGIAAEKQAQASLASKLSTAKKKILAGKAPTPGEQLAIDSLTPEEFDKWNNTVQEVAAANTVAKEALEAQEAAEAAAKAAEKAAKAAEKKAKEAAAEAKALAEAEAQAEHDAAGQDIEDIINNPKGQTLKAKAIKKLQDTDPLLQFSDPASFLQQAEGMAAEAQAAASKASLLSGAKKKLLAGKDPTPSQQKVIDGLEPFEFVTWDATVQDAITAANSETEGLKITPEPGQLNKSKALTSLSNLDDIESSVFFDFVDGFPQADINDMVVNPGKIVPYDDAWEEGEKFTIKKDVEKEKTPNKLVKVKISDLETTQVWVSKKTVADYIESGELGSTNPTHKDKPPMVVKVNGQLQLHDGNHRVAAWKLAGETEIEVLVYDLDPQEGTADTAKVKEIAAKVPSTTSPDLEVKSQEVFIPDATKLIFVKDLPGSTNPQLMRDTVTGKQWVVKSPEQGGGGAAHLKSEATSDQVYRLMGASVPASEYQKKGSQHYKIAEYVEDSETLGKWQNKSTTSAQGIELANTDLKKHFVLDALLGNRDVAGQNNDNILVHEGKPIRIDNGGALAYRAQGKKKVGAEFGPEVGELLSMRDSAIAAGKTADIYAGITQGEIDSQIVDILAKRSELVELVSKNSGKAVGKQLDKRIDWLEKQLPASKRTAKVATPTSEAGLSTTFRANAETGKGASIAAGNRNIEDQELLAWRENTADGKKITKLQGYLTREGSVEFLDTMNRAGLNVKEISASSTSAASTVAKTKPSIHDKVWDSVAKAAGNIGYHADDGKYSGVQMVMYQDAKEEIEQMKAGLPAKPSKAKGTANYEKAQLVKHYEKVFKDLDHAMETQTKPKGDPSGGYWKQYEPPIAAAAQKAATPGNKNDVTVNGVKITRYTGDFNYTQKERINGVLVDTEVRNHEGNVGVSYKIKAGPVEATVVPYLKDSTQQKARSIQGMVRVNIEGSDTSAAALEGLRVLEAAGIPTAPPTQEQKELLYLHKTFYLRGDTERIGYTNITNNGGLSDTQKVAKLKQWGEARYNVTLPKGVDPKKYTKYYNPDGETDLDGGGRKIYRRWDKSAAEMEAAEEKSKFFHGTSDIVESTLGFLKAGFVTPSNDRMRMGIPLRDQNGNTIGQSWQGDFNKGGSDYMYISKLAAGNRDTKEGFHFSGESLSRADLASHTYDSWGAWEANDGTTRNRTVESLLQVASEVGSHANTGLMKGGARLQDITHIRVTSDSQRKALIRRIKEELGMTKWPDGRALDEVIK